MGPLLLAVAISSCSLVLGQRRAQFGCPDTDNAAAENGFLVTNDHSYLGLSLASYSDYEGTYKATCTTKHGFTLPPKASGYALLDGSVYTVNPKWKVPNYGGGWSTVLSAPLSQAYLNYCSSGNTSQGAWSPSRLVFGSEYGKGSPIWCDDDKQCESWPGTRCLDDHTNPGRPPVGLYQACQVPKVPAPPNNTAAPPPRLAPTTTAGNPDAPADAAAEAAKKTAGADAVAPRLRRRLKSRARAQQPQDEDDQQHQDQHHQDQPSNDQGEPVPKFPRTCNYGGRAKPFPGSCSCPSGSLEGLARSAVVEVEGEGIFATCALDGICRQNWEGLVKVADDEAVAHARALQGTAGRLSAGLVRTGSTSSAYVGKSISFVRHADDGNPNETDDVPTGNRTGAAAAAAAAGTESPSPSTGCAIRTMFVEAAAYRRPDGGDPPPHAAPFRVRFAVAPVASKFCRDGGKHIAAVHGNVVAHRDPDRGGGLSFYELHFDDDATHTSVRVAHVFDMDERRSATVGAMEVSDCGVPAPCPDPATCPVKLCFFVIGATLVEMRRTAIDAKETIYDGIPAGLDFGARLGLPLYRNYDASGLFDGFVGIARNATSGAICSTSLSYGLGANGTHVAYGSWPCVNGAFGSHTDWTAVGFASGSFYEWDSNDGIAYADYSYGSPGPTTWHPFPFDPETGASFLAHTPDWAGRKRAVLLNFYGDLPL